MKPETQYDVVSLLRRAFKTHADSTAIEFSNKSISYSELNDLSDKISSYLISNHKNEQFIAISGTKDLFNYTSIIGIFKSGKAYVPLNPKFPVERNKEILKESGAKTLFSNENLNYDEVDRVSEKVINQSSLKTDSTYVKGENAYLLFTSGSTGKPKGVLIKHQQLLAYLENIQKIFKVVPGEKCSHTFDLSFDLSVHDIFVTFIQGGTLVVPSENELLSPSSYIKNRKINHWFSVPSWLKIMEKLRQLKPENFPELKTVLFCGEALQATHAQKIRTAVPNAKIFNLYGPTEATVAISAYEIKNDPENKNGHVCIGKIFNDNQCLILDEKGKQSFEGELLLHGKQVITSYFSGNDVEEKFHLINGTKWYKTGDIVTENNEHELFFVGRKDNQVKINGYRAELGEIEHEVNLITGLTTVCFVRKTEGTDILTAVLEGKEKISRNLLLEMLSKKLPTYMLPQQIVYLQSFPLNANGKIDRNKIKELL